MSDFSDSMAKFFFEVGILSRFKRSGLDFLGTGNQNIASHIFRTAVIGYMLAVADAEADEAKTALLCLFHDLPETRTGDINQYQKNYVVKDEGRAAFDMFKGVPNPKECEGYIHEFNNGTSKEALFARDADVLELILTLKEEFDNGNNQAKIWINKALDRLVTQEAHDIADRVISMKSYDWWLNI